ncbi:SDR family NAD(P)-dependent oxidoreductase [Pelosinus baikalensis]|uniref:SDR family NAD(P)-dependent oxidoreductase n=1 Tax=Pelosinus baikalensis TaxID=2892015 RepID=A0ABS8HLA9_9FIRM|nr:SDR family NAD(P)-dependent oxidoreductase [Pelosinus baikalensis]MCC5463956.1 SDR family NAD(P)-dependent oxidoreductase [Pelosinus baikalensis]
MKDFLQYILYEVKNKRLAKIDAKDLIRQLQTQVISAKSDFIHPLLHQNISDLSSQRFSSTFTGQEFFFADHVVQGKRILPGVAYLEMAREAVKQAIGDLEEDKTQLKIKNIVWSRPITVEEQPVKVNIELYPEDNGEITYEVSSESEKAGIEPVVHSQGIAVLSSAWKAPTLDLKELEAHCNQSLSSSQFYQAYSAMGIDYGPGHRGIVTAYIGSGQVLAKLSLPSTITTMQDQFVLHPSLMDSALQASLGLMMGDSTRPLKLALPFALQEIEIFGNCSLTMWALIRYSEGSKAGDNVQKLDIDLCDEIGNVCVRMKGFTSRMLEGEVGTIGSSETIETLRLTPCWKEQTAVQEAVLPDYVQHVVVLCEPDGVTLESIKTQMRGVHCLVLQSKENSIEERFQTYAVQIFEEIQSILKERLTGKALVQIVVCTENEQQLFFGLSGLLKTAQLENPKLIGQLIGVDRWTNSEEIIEKLKENCQSPFENQIQYQEEKRLVSGWREVEASQEEVGIPWKDQGIYLITGGAGGLGLIFANDIAHKVKNVSLILTGRSPLREDKQEKIKELEQVGVRIEYKQIDVTQKQAVSDLIDSVQKQYGRLDGIIHGAGVNRDNFIIKKTRDEFLKVLSPKVTGLVNLDQASRNLNLDFFVLFSSIAGSLGNLGQADYATANAFMDVYARYRNTLVDAKQRQGQTLSINWPLWKEGGMHVDEETEKMMMQSMGMIAMKTPTGIRALYQGLASGKEQVMVMEGKLARMKQKLLMTTYNTQQSKVSATTEVNMGNILDNVQNVLLQAVSKLLKVKSEDIDVDADLSEYGFDSITFTEFANQLNQEYNLELTPTIFFEYPTLHSFAEYLVEEHQAVFKVEPEIVPIASDSTRGTDMGNILDNVQTVLLQAVSKLLKVKSEDVDVEADLSEYGFDSIAFTEFANQLNQEYSLELTPTIFFEYPTLHSFAEYLVEEHQAVFKVEPEIVPIASDSTRGTDMGNILDNVQAVLLQAVSKLLKVKSEDVDADADLSEYGFDSITFTEFANQLNQEYSLELTPTIFFEYPTLHSFAEYLVEEHQAVLKTKMGVQIKAEPPVQVKEEEVEEILFSVRKKRSRFARMVTAPTLEAANSSKPDTISPEPIAIVGISGIFPMAKDVNDFWKNLTEGKDCITEIPKERWDWREYYGDPKQDRNKTNAKWGGFIDGIDEFDPLFFGISPKEAEFMDPQQRLLMTYVWKAIEDAGYSAQSLSGTNTGIFVGTTGTGYMQLVFQANRTIEGYFNTGIVPSVGPNRMSYFLNVHGPSEPIETACSSSLIAIHRAVSAIENGTCEMAIVGGVNTIMMPEVHISFNKAGMLSEDGRCKTFSDKANGYVRGEGAGMVFLKKLKDAEQAGDHIYGIIRGSAENHGGHANSLTAPNPKAQAQVLKAAYTKAGIDPRTVTYIEAHGTGTKLGDPIEVNGLKMAFQELYETSGYAQVAGRHCGLGSVKSNVGHLELSAGIAGVIKVLLQLKNKTLVKTLHCDTLNPYINLDNSPFYIVQETQEWKALKDAYGNDLPRRAGVSSFGFGGANAHIVFEEYVPKIQARSEMIINSQNPAMIVLSAKNEEQLQEQARQLLTAIQEQKFSDADLADIAYTLQVGRDAMEERLAMIVKTTKELEAKLKNFVEGKESIEDLYLGQVRRNKEAFAVFAADEDMAKTIDAWFTKRKYGKLLELWVKGLVLDWNKLYGDSKPQRISLPTYPFARERYWVPEVEPINTTSPAIATSINPLLYQSTSNFSEQSFGSAFTGQELFAADPVMKGEDFRLNAADDITIQPQEHLKVLTNTDAETLKSASIDQLKVLLEGVTKIPANRLDADAHFEELGLDSIMISILNQKIEQWIGKLDATMFFKYNTIRTLGAYLVKAYPDAVSALVSKANVPTLPQHHRSQTKEIPTMVSTYSAKPWERQVSSSVPDTHPWADIAIIGLAGRYPQAATLDQFWKNLYDGKDCIEEIPPQRWSLDGFFEPDRAKAAASGLSYSKWGGFLEGIDYFDPLFFNILPRDAMLMDPQERLFLEVAWECLEDAGYTRKSLREDGYGNQIGVFVGATFNNYQLLAAESAVRAKQELYPAYSQMFSIANRVSFVMNLTGPSLTVDTACSSSLYAIHLACESIRSGQSRMAIAGGANLSLHPSKYILLSQGQFNASDGRCRAFCEGGTGYVPAEAVGAVFLKPLQDAIKDQDIIYGVIKGSATSHAGKTNGYTVPSPVSQSLAIEKALALSQISPRSISCIEAHGTGTALGDPIEITGLTDVFQKYTKDTSFCSISSVKSNIGHPEAAAGIAQLTKVLLQLKHKTLVRNVMHGAGLNPNIDFAQTPFIVQAKTEHWKRPLIDGREVPRRAGISSFGAGGANAHIVVEEYLPRDQERSSITITTHNPAIIVLSAKEEDRLKEYAERLLATIQEEQFEENSLADIAYTLQVGRETMEERLAMTVLSIKELEEKLKGFLQEKSGIEDFYRGQVKRNKDTLTMFTGNEDLLIENCIKSGKYSQLMDLWTKGLNFDWEKLYGNYKPRRISLPAYPFARESYWIPEVKSSITTESSVAAAIHPLLHQNTSNFSEQRFSSNFTGQEFFLADHVVKGQCVLPEAAYLEMVRAAVAEAAGTLEEEQTGLWLKNIVWARSIAVNRQPIQVHIGLYPEGNGEISYEIYTKSVEGNKEPIVHSQGTAVLSGIAKAPTVDLETLQVQCSPNTLSSNQCYETFKAMGIEYGLGYRGIEKVYVGSGQVLAKISLPQSAADTKDHYVLHPSVMEAVLQASICLRIGNDELKPIQLFALNDLELFSKCTSAMWAFIRYSDGSVAGNQGEKLDIDLYDEQGKVCVRMKGYSTKRLDDEMDAVEASTDVGTVMFYPSWKEQAVGREVTAPDYAQHLVMLCERDDVSRESIETQMGGVRYITVTNEQDGIDKRFQSYAIQVFEEIKSILESKPKGKVLIQIVVSSQKEQQLFSGLSGLSGLLKTAKLENPRIIGQLIEVEAGEDSYGIIEKLKENSRSPIDNYIRYQDGTRYVSNLSKLEVPGEKEVIPWKDQGIYLITGGSGGLGLIFAKEIVQRVKGVTLIVTGRSPLKEDKQSQLQELRLLGARIEYRQVDVNQKEAVADLIQSIQKDFGTLNGIVHGAGIIRDNFIIKKTKKELQEVMLPKVTGLVNVDQASKNLPLDFLILFSSVAGPMGNPGQADYAAANAFMDAYAKYRNTLVAEQQRHGKTLAMNWPLWKDGGMHIDEETEKMMMQSVGIITMQTSSGIRALYQSLASGKEQVMVMEGDLERIQEYLLDTPAKSDLHLSNAAMPQIDPEILKEKTVHQLKVLLGEVTKLGIARIDAEESLENYGIDSIVITQLNHELAGIFGELSKTLFYEYPNLASLAEYLVADYSQICMRWTGLGDQAQSILEPENLKKSSPALHLDSQIPVLTSLKAGRKQNRSFANNVLSNGEQEPIAIIGMSGRYPQAKNLKDYWENLKSGKDCITEIPAERWSLDGFFHPSKQEAIAQGKSYSKWGGFIDGFADFDPQFFNISPREAGNMDPQERLFLESCWEVFEDAGYTKEQLAVKYNGRIGVFAGITKTGFELYAPDLWKQGKIVFPHTSFSSVANRISYLLNLQGPSMPIDTMCSASLTAIHEASEHIRRGECEMAIAGGVNLYLHSSSYIGLSAQQMLSVDGRCKSFGQGGNGFVPGEGVGAILLKGLSQAIADEDHIYAIIRGTSINHGGKTNGYTVPNPAAQGDVIRRALDKAGVNARTTSYIEAHGTGTELGDPIEITGLSQAFRKDTQDTEFCAIGSAKSNIGHLEAAAGIAGVTKIVLQMKHQKIVPSLHAKDLNPNINFAKTPFVVQQELAEWKRPVIEINGEKKEYPRIAGISAFGAGGSNAHVVIEEYIAKEQERPRIAITTQNPAIVVLSAKNEARLKEQVQQLLIAIEEQQFTDLDLANLAYTLQVGREAMEERLAVIAGSIKELNDKLKSFVEGNNGIVQMYRGQVKCNKDTLAIFADEDLQLAIDNWISKGKYTKLLDIWVKGLVFDWNKIYGEIKPRRISLPTYPFSRERFWIPEAIKDSQVSLSDGQANFENRNKLLHRIDSEKNTSVPLKGKRISSPLKEVQFEYIMNTDNFAELKDNHNVLHVGYYQEMLCDAVKDSFNTSSYVVNHMEFLSALRFTESSSRIVNLLFSPEDENGFMKFQFNSREIDKNEWSLHVTGSLKINKDIEHNRLAVEELSYIMEQSEQYLASEFYQKIHEQGFRLGDSVKWVDQVWHRDGEILARFRPFTEAEKIYNYSIGIHPGVLDACAQLFVFAGSDCLPPGTVFMVVEMKEFHLNCVGNRDKAIWCHFILDKNGEKNNYIQGEYKLFDDDGLILVQARGKKVKKLDIKRMEVLKLTRDEVDGIKSSWIMDEIRSKTGASKTQALEQYLRQTMAEQLGMLPENLDVDEPLRDLGMDSIAAVNFISMVDKSLGIKIPAEEILQGPSIKELAATLKTEFQEIVAEPENVESRHKLGILKVEEMESYLRQIMAEQLGMLPENLDIDEPLRDLGMDSIVAVNFISMVDKSLGIKIPAEDILQGPSIKELAVTLKTKFQEFIVEPEVEKSKLKEKNQASIWYAHRIIKENAKFRLFCIPFGGAGASLYRTWQANLPDYIEVCPIQLPGKENRIKEQPIDNISDAICVLEKAIKPELDIPYGFYGHSFGALISYRLAYYLWKNSNNKPSHLFVGGFTAPSSTPNPNFERRLALLKSMGFKGIPSLSDIECFTPAQLKEIVNEIGGMKGKVVEEDMARKLIGGAFSDLRIVESFTYKEEELFDIPITAFHGKREDRVTETDMQSWSNNTTSSCKLHVLSGDHFFLNKEQNQDELLALIKEDINKYIS